MDKKRLYRTEGQFKMVCGDVVPLLCDNQCFFRYLTLSALLVKLHHFNSDILLKLYCILFVLSARQPGFCFSHLYLSPAHAPVVNRHC